MTNGENAPFGKPNISEQFVTERLPVGWPWRLVIFSTLLFALSLLIYFGLRLGYRNYLDGRVKSLDGELDRLSQAVKIEDQEQFINFYSQFVNLKTVLDQHTFASNVFKFLEKKTVPNVYFNGAEMKVNDLNLNLKGVAASFDALAAQVAVFKNSAELKQVLLGDIALQSGGVSFTLTLTFGQEFLSKPSS